MAYRWIIVALALFVSGCATHNSTVKVGDDTVGILYSLPEDQALSYAKRAVTKVFPGRSISKTEIPYKGYSVMDRSIIDTYTHNIFIIPSSGQDEYGKLVHGYRFDTTGNGSLFNGPSKNSELLDTTIEFLKRTNTGIFVSKITEISDSVNATATAPTPAAVPDLAYRMVADDGNATLSGVRHALVMGSDNYQHLARLETAIADAKAIGSVLRDQYGFVTNELLDARRSDIISALDGLRAKIGENDTLLIYYAGHGWLDREADRGYWLPVDAREQSRANWLSNADVADTLRALKARHVLVVVDSCYSGSLTRAVDRGIGAEPQTTTRYQDMLRRKSRTVLTSGGLEPVADGGGGGHSVFTKALLDALTRTVGLFDGTQLFSYVREQVRLGANQTPQYSIVQNSGHEVGGDFVFIPR